MGKRSKSKSQQKRENAVKQDQNNQEPKAPKKQVSKVKCENCDGRGLDPADFSKTCGNCKGRGRVTVEKEA